MPIIGHGMSFVKSNNSRNMHHAKTSNWNDIAKYAVLSLADIGVLFALLWIIRNVWTREAPHWRGAEYGMKNRQKERPAETGRARRENSLINVSIGDFQSVVKFMRKVSFSETLSVAVKILILGIALGISAFVVSVGWSIGMNIMVIRWTSSVCLSRENPSSPSRQEISPMKTCDGIGRSLRSSSEVSVLSSSSERCAASPCWWWFD